jgi:hypothetical protein
MQRLPWDPFHKGSGKDSVLAKTGVLQYTQSYLGLECPAAWQIDLSCFPATSDACCLFLLLLFNIPATASHTEPHDSPTEALLSAVYPS